MSDDDHVLAAGMVPTPFSAAEIRVGCPAGRTVVVRVEDDEGTHHRLSRFAEVDDNGTLYERAECDEHGAPTGEVTSSRLSWLDLQAHASFPESVTTRDEVVLEYPLGAEECWRYVVEDADGVATFWFSKKRSGMPVKVTQAVGGVVVATSEMVADSETPATGVSPRI